MWYHMVPLGGNGLRFLISNIKLYGKCGSYFMFFIYFYFKQVRLKTFDHSAAGHNDVTISNYFGGYLSMPCNPPIISTYKVLLWSLQIGLFVIPLKIIGKYFTVLGNFIKNFSYQLKIFRNLIINYMSLKNADNMSISFSYTMEIKNLINKLTIENQDYVIY